MDRTVLVESDALHAIVKSPTLLSITFKYDAVYGLCAIDFIVIRFKQIADIGYEIGFQRAA